MSRKFHLSNNYYDEKETLYKKTDITLKPGVTVLVGCNGVGKTTMLWQLQEKLKKKDIPCVFYNNLEEGGSSSISEALFRGDMAFGATAMCSSEGENIVMNMGKLAKRLGTFIQTGKDKPRYSQMAAAFKAAGGISTEEKELLKERWVLLDAIDSGLSVDNIVDLKEYLFQTILEHSKKLDIETYIVISANEYEMARGEQCFLVHEGKYIPIDSYDAYRELILQSRKYKEERYTAIEEFSDSEEPNKHLTI